MKTGTSFIQNVLWGNRERLREDGSLDLYESDDDFAAAELGWQARERFGIAYRHVADDELADMQPGLSPRFIKGTFVPNWKTVADPKLLGKAIWRYAELFELQAAGYR